MIKKLQKKYALSEQGAKDLIKGCLAVSFRICLLCFRWDFYITWSAI